MYPDLPVLESFRAPQTFCLILFLACVRQPPEISLSFSLLVLFNFLENATVVCGGNGASITPPDMEAVIWLTRFEALSSFILPVAFAPCE